jgi:beta-galactosidase
VSSGPSAGGPAADSLDAVVAAVVAASGVRPVVAGLPAGVEAARRGDLVTLINHGDERVEIAMEGTDAETGVAVDRVVLDAQCVAFVTAPASVRVDSAAPPAAAVGVSRAEPVQA